MKRWIRQLWKWVPKLALAGGVAAMAGCATLNTPVSHKAQMVAYHNACVAYSAGFAGALAAGEDGYLTKADIQQVNLMDENITPLCRKQPTSLTTATTEITQAITKLAIYESLAIKAKGAAK